MTIDIDDIRQRNHFAIMNTATGKHLDAALTEICRLREEIDTAEHVDGIRIQNRRCAMSNNVLKSELERWADQPHEISLHQVRLVSTEAIESRKENERLRAENERLREEIERLQVLLLDEPARTALDSDYDRREDRERQLLEQIKKDDYEAGRGP